LDENKGTEKRKWRREMRKIKYRRNIREIIFKMKFYMICPSSISKAI